MQFFRNAGNYFTAFPKNAEKLHQKCQKLKADIWLEVGLKLSFSHFPPKKSPLKRTYDSCWYLVWRVHSQQWNSHVRVEKTWKVLFFWSRSRRRSFPSSLSSGVSMGRHMLLSHWPFCSASSHFLPLLDSQCSWNSIRVKKNLRKSSSMFSEFFSLNGAANDTHQRNVVVHLWGIQTTTYALIGFFTIFDIMWVNWTLSWAILEKKSRK